MKRIFLRLTTLSLLIAAFWFGNMTSANKVSCQDIMFAEQSACDDSLSTTIYNYREFQQYRPNCVAPAQNACAGLTGTNYDACFQRNFDSCADPIVIPYNDRYGTYGNCVSSTFNLACTSEPDFCSAARARADQCVAMYPQGGEDLSAYMDCRNASGVDMCQ